jgi:hypothetical protein
LKNKIKNKTQKMSADLYTISEIFSEYPDLALLWKQTGKLQYKVCFNVNHMAQLPISRNEFYNYFSSMKYMAFQKIILFSADKNGTIFSIDHYSGNSRLPFEFSELVETVLHVTKFTSGFDLAEYKFNDGTSRYTRINQVCSDQREIILHNYMKKNGYPWSNFKLYTLPESFRDPLSKVFFDVLTTYEILKTRKACSQMIKNYAKQKTMEQFDRLFNFFINKNLASCDLYVGLNARKVGVDVDEIMVRFPDKKAQLLEAAFKIKNIINTW